MASRKFRKGRKGSRKGRKASRRFRKNQMGGWQTLNPAGINDKTMMSPSSQSLAQGQDYDKIHMGQHGGAYTPMAGAPINSTGMLDASLREAARVGGIDSSMAAIKGMSDQSGGGRRRSSKHGGRRSKNGGRRRSKHGGRRSKHGGRRSKHGGRRSMRQRGGNHMRPGDYSGPTLLLPPSMESKAVAAMNPEWNLAKDPNSFAPMLGK